MKSLNTPDSSREKQEEFLRMTEWYCLSEGITQRHSTKSLNTPDSSREKQEEFLRMTEWV
jgi:hypothetical protein